MLCTVKSNRPPAGVPQPRVSEPSPQNATVSLPFCYRISKRKFLTCVLSTTYAFHRVKRSISLPRLANASERNRTLLPGSLQGKQNETKRDDFTISSHFNIAVPGTYDDSPPRCLVFCSPASERNRTNPNAFAAIRLSGFSLCIPHFALCTQKPIQNPPVSHPKIAFFQNDGENFASRICKTE